MTYPLLGGGLLVVALALRIVGEAVARRRGRHIPLAPTLLAAAVLIPLTAVFDSLMIAAGLFEYAEAQIAGIRIGLAPIEDFTYPLALVLLMPAVWELASRGARDGAR